MEHPSALAEGRGLYRWHAGAPDDDSFGRPCEPKSASPKVRAGSAAAYELAARSAWKSWRPSASRSGSR